MALDTKIREAENKLSSHDKYITSPIFDKFSGAILDKRLILSNLASKSDLDTVPQQAGKNGKKL